MEPEAKRLRAISGSSAVVSVGSSPNTASVVPLLSPAAVLGAERRVADSSSDVVQAVRISALQLSSQMPELEWV
jgi:hypothetical protein